MTKTRSVSVRLARLFPPNDEYAVVMARLCILWEDFMTEASGGSAESIPKMDGNSPQWRRLYFLRRSISTIHEIRNALHQLRMQKQFKHAHAKQPRPRRVSFQNSYKKLIRHEKQLKSLRNNIGGGHVQHDAVREGLNRMDPDVHGILQHGERYKDIRYKCARTLVLETLFPGHATKDAEVELEAFFSKMMDEATDSALKMIEYAFYIYTNERC